MHWARLLHKMALKHRMAGSYGYCNRTEQCTYSKLRPFVPNKLCDQEEYSSDDFFAITEWILSDILMEWSANMLKLQKIVPFYFSNAPPFSPFSSFLSSFLYFFLHVITTISLSCLKLSKTLTSLIREIPSHLHSFWCVTTDTFSFLNLPFLHFSHFVLKLSSHLPQFSLKSLAIPSLHISADIAALPPYCSPAHFPVEFLVSSKTQTMSSSTTLNLYLMQNSNIGYITVHDICWCFCLFQKWTEIPWKQRFLLTTGRMHRM